MAFEVAGAIVVNLILIATICIMVYFILYYRKQAIKCANSEREVCYTIHCPVDDAKQGPCFGFAIRKGEGDGFYCSNKPSVLVDKNGKPIHL